MNENNRGQSSVWNTFLLPLLSAVAGVTALWATWFFYKDSLSSPEFHWYLWIQPILMVLAGVLSLVAAGLLLMRKPIGKELLSAALSIIPLILAIRLVIVVMIFVGNVIRWGYDGTLLDWIHHFSLASPKIVISLAVIAAIYWFKRQIHSKAK